jgi:hypothetical protein
VKSVAMHVFPRLNPLAVAPFQRILLGQYALYRFSISIRSMDAYVLQPAPVAVFSVTENTLNC